MECGQAYYLVTENGLAYSIAETTFIAPTTSQTVSVDMAIETYSQDCPPYDLGCLLGLNHTPSKDNATYLNNWLEVLKKDKKAMVKAFGMAQKASDYILQYDAELKKAA